MTQDTSSFMTHDSLLLHPYATDAYLKYAVAVVKSRALIKVHDGQKPVQRRILYAMHQLGLTPPNKHVKAARIVGDVLGKYHPHGDSAAYDALVRVAQDFSLRYPLIEGQGNFGSRDGDSAAAMRYTEARLAPISSLLLSELNQGTVDFGPNYDNTLQEPLVLPARLPFTLLNGAIGIAVGMACSIPSHNLREVAELSKLFIAHGDVSDDEMFSVLPGPDFPDGGQLIATPQEIASAYTSGRGALRMRAVWTKEDLARGQWQVVISELPYGVAPGKVLEELEALTNPQPPAGKKSITPQQAALRATSLELLERVVNEGDKNQPIRLVVHPRTSKVSYDAMMQFLTANTSLEQSFSLNMTLIGLDGKPCQKSLRSVMQEWCEFRINTVTRRTKNELAQTLARIHILEGRQIAFDNLDAVIKVIRSEDEPKPKLMASFNLSDIQAVDILEMRLRALSRLEGHKLIKDLTSLKAEQERLEKLLASDSLMRKLIIKEIDADAKQFGDDRRTKLNPEVKSNASKATSAAIVKATVDEPITVVLSSNYLIKAYKGHDLADDQLSFRQGESLLAKVQSRTSWPIILLDTLGRVYTVDATQLPDGRRDGLPVTTLIELQEGAKIVTALAAGPEHRYLLSGKKGYGFVASAKNMLATRKAGKAFLALKEGEMPMHPVQLPEDGSGYLVMGSSDGRLLIASANEVKTLAGGGQGVMLMILEGPQTLSAIWHQPEVTEVQGFIEVSGANQPLSLKADDLKKYLGKRARKGSQLPKKGALQPQ